MVGTAGHGVVAGGNGLSFGRWPNDVFLKGFVDRTRLKCLDYLSPLEALTNPPGPDRAGTHVGGTLW